MKGDTIQIHK